MGQRYVSIVADLIFEARIRLALSADGWTGTSIRTVEALAAAVAPDPPSLVLIDLACVAADVAGALRHIRQCCSEVRLVAYGPHVDHTLLQEARSAGTDEVLARSAFVSRLTSLAAAPHRHE